MAAPRILFPSSSSSSSPMLLVNPSIGVGVGVGSSPLMVGYLTSSTRSKLVTMCCSNINNHVNNIHTCSCKNKNKNKIFEDGSAGIVCYRDENGEITCEGYDEGPRFHHNLSTFHYNNTPTPTTTTYRDVEIIQQLLQRCWLQVAEDEDEDEDDEDDDDEDDGEN